MRAAPSKSDYRRELVVAKLLGPDELDTKNGGEDDNYDADDADNDYKARFANLGLIAGITNGDGAEIQCELNKDRSAFIFEAYRSLQRPDFRSGESVNECEVIHKDVKSLIEESNKYRNRFTNTASSIDGDTANDEDKEEGEEAAEDEDENENDRSKKSSKYRSTFKDTLKARELFGMHIRKGRDDLIKRSNTTASSSGGGTSIAIKQDSTSSADDNATSKVAIGPTTKVAIGNKVVVKEIGCDVSKCSRCSYIRSLSNFQNMYTLSDKENTLCIESDICGNALDEVYLLTEKGVPTNATTAATINTASSGGGGDDGSINSLILSNGLLKLKLRSGAKIRHNRSPYKLDRGWLLGSRMEGENKDIMKAHFFDSYSGRVFIDTHDSNKDKREEKLQLSQSRHLSPFSKICKSNPRGKIALLLCDLTICYEVTGIKCGTSILSDRGTILLQNRTNKSVTDEITLEQLFDGTRKWDNRLVDPDNAYQKPYCNNYLYYDDNSDCRFLDMFGKENRSNKEEEEFMKHSLLLCQKYKLKSSASYFYFEGRRREKTNGDSSNSNSISNRISNSNSSNEDFESAWSAATATVDSSALEKVYPRYNVYDGDTKISKNYNYVAQMHTSATPASQQLKLRVAADVEIQLNRKTPPYFCLSDFFSWTSIGSLDFLLVLEEKELRLFACPKDLNKTKIKEKKVAILKATAVGSSLSRMIVIESAVPHVLLVEVETKDKSFVDFQICSLDHPAPSVLKWKIPGEKDMLLRSSISDICVHAPERESASSASNDTSSSSSSNNSNSSSVIVVANLVVSCIYNPGKSNSYDGFRAYQISFDSKCKHFEIELLWHHAKPYLEQARKLDCNNPLKAAIALASSLDACPQDEEANRTTLLSDKLNLLTKQKLLEEKEKKPENYFRRCVKLIPFHQSACYMILYSSPYYEEVVTVPVNFDKLKDYKASFDDICPFFKGYLRPLPSVDNLNEKMGYNSTLDTCDFATIKLNRMFPSQYIASIGVVNTKLSDHLFEGIEPFWKTADEYDEDTKTVCTLLRKPRSSSRSYPSSSTTTTKGEKNRINMSNSPILVVQTRALPGYEVEKQHKTVLCDKILVALDKKGNEKEVEELVDKLRLIDHRVKDFKTYISPSAIAAAVTAATSSSSSTADKIESGPVGDLPAIVIDKDSPTAYTVEKCKARINEIKRDRYTIESDSIGKLMFFGFSCMDIAEDVEPDAMKAYTTDHIKAFNKYSLTANEIKVGSRVGKIEEEVIVDGSNVFTTSKSMFEDDNMSFHYRGWDLCKTVEEKVKRLESDKEKESLANSYIDNAKFLVEQSGRRKWEEEIKVLRDKDQYGEEMSDSELLFRTDNGPMRMFSYVLKSDFLTRYKEPNNPTSDLPLIPSKLHVFGDNGGNKDSYVCDLSEYFQLKTRSDSFKECKFESSRPPPPPSTPPLVASYASAIASSSSSSSSSYSSSSSSSAAGGGGGPQKGPDDSD